MALYGPYYRVESLSQTEEDIEKQLQSKEIWGGVPRNVFNSHIPKVKAYLHWRYGPKRKGIVFWTTTPPDKGCMPEKPTWSGEREGVRIEDGYAKIKAVVISRYP